MHMGWVSVSYGLWGSLAILVIAGIYAYIHSRDRASDQRGISCDHSEDAGFYEDIDPQFLPLYQDALNEIFYWLDVQHFTGSTIPRAQRGQLEELLRTAAANPHLNPKYVWVMLAQYLQSDSGVRQQRDLAANWAETVVGLDRTGARGSAPRIPSAWKVYFKNSLQEELQSRTMNIKS